MSSQFGDYFIDTFERMFYNSFTPFDKFPPPAWDIMEQKESGGGRCMTPEEMFNSLTYENKEIFIHQIETLLAEQEAHRQSPDSSE